MTTQDLTTRQLDEVVQHVLAICSILGLQLPVAQAPAVSYPSATRTSKPTAIRTPEPNSVNDSRASLDGWWMTIRSAETSTEIDKNWTFQSPKRPSRAAFLCVFVERHTLGTKGTSWGHNDLWIAQNKLYFCSVFRNRTPHIEAILTLRKTMHYENNWFFGHRPDVQRHAEPERE